MLVITNRPTATVPTSWAHKPVASADTITRPERYMRASVRSRMQAADDMHAHGIAPASCNATNWVKIIQPCIVMACMAYIVMVCIFMVCIVMADSALGRHQPAVQQSTRDVEGQEQAVC